MITIGAVRALRRLGAQHSVALVAFDDFLLADLLSPGVTVIAQDPTAIGRMAARLLFARIEGDISPRRPAGPDHPDPPGIGRTPSI